VCAFAALAISLDVVASSIEKRGLMHLFLGALLAGVMTASVTPSGIERSDAGFVLLGVGDEWVARAVEDEAPEELRALARPEAAASDGGPVYSADLSDDELARRFREDLPSLGSISIGVTEAGRVVNAVRLPPGEAWTIADPERAYGTQETIDFLTTVANDVHSAYPQTQLRVGHIGAERGGWLRPHQSHQAGRDVDLGFFYQAGVDPGAPRQPREKLMDLAVNWALLRSVVINTDVQFVLLDRRVQRVLREYALLIGENKAWVDSLFLGPDSLVKHAPRHRDHFHVRFYSARSQELGRRLVPILVARPDENLVIHRVAPGDTLGKLAARYGSTVRSIQANNGLASATALRVGSTLRIPLRGPCTSCPIPPPLSVPPRRLPPEPGPAS